VAAAALLVSAAGGLEASSQGAVVPRRSLSVQLAGARQEASHRSASIAACRHRHRGGAHCAAAGRRHGAAAAVSAQRLYWGAWIGSQLTGAEAPWDFRAVSRFEQNAGRGVSIVSFASPFMNCTTPNCSSYNFPRTPFAAIRAHGAIPLLSWSSAAEPTTPLQPGFRLQDVIGGRFDAYLLKWAAAAREWGHPFFLRFDWEMNASSFPWSVHANGNTPSEYVTAWRHVHDLFTRVGATNATWVWCPNADAGQSPSSLASLYPGNSYVDWTCLDGYNANNPWRSFQSVFQSYYSAISERIAPSKPMLVGETASTEAGGSKASWISGMFSSLPRMPDIHALIWFDRPTGGDWPLETSPGAQTAFKRGVSAGTFAGNEFSGLETSPIPAP